MTGRKKERKKERRKGERKEGRKGGREGEKEGEKEGGRSLRSDYLEKLFPRCWRSHESHLQPRPKCLGLHPGGRRGIKLGDQGWEERAVEERAVMQDFFFFETKFPSCCPGGSAMDVILAHYNLCFLGSGDSPVSASCVAGITRAHHHTH